MYLLQVMLAASAIFTMSQGVTIDQCTFKGQTFNAATTLITDDCQWKCNCTALEYSVRTSCASLCPEYNVRCKVEETVVYDELKFNGTKCKCTVPRCKAPSLKEAVCDYRGKKFKANHTLITDDCQSKCSCTVEDQQTSVMCAALCPKYTIKCDAGEKIVYKNQLTGWKNCSCKVPVCKKLQIPKKTCTFKGKTIDVDDFVITDDCRERCKCQLKGDNTSVSCEAVCPQPTIHCRYDQVIAHDLQHVVGSRCTCWKPKCVARPCQDNPAVKYCKWKRYMRRLCPMYQYYRFHCCAACKEAMSG